MRKPHLERNFPAVARGDREESADSFGDLLEPEVRSELESEREMQEISDMSTQCTRTTPDPSALPSASVHEAIRTYSMADLHLHCRHGTDVNAVDHRGMTALHCVADGHPSECDVEMARALLQAGADTSLMAPQMGTALHVATEYGNLPLVEILVKADSPIDAGDGSNGWTALHVASEQSFVGLVEALLTGRADPNVQSPAGTTPLHLAEIPEIARLLLQAGANPNLADVDGQTPLHMAGVKVASALVEAGADLEAKDGAGYTPLFVAIDKHSHPRVEVLLSLGANVNAPDPQGGTPLEYLFAGGFETGDEFLGMLDALVEAGADIGIGATTERWILASYAYSFPLECLEVVTTRAPGTIPAFLTVVAQGHMGDSEALAEELFNLPASAFVHITRNDVLPLLSSEDQVMRNVGMRLLPKIG